MAAEEKNQNPAPEQDVPEMQQNLADEAADKVPAGDSAEGSAEDVMEAQVDEEAIAAEADAAVNGVVNEGDILDQDEPAGEDDGADLLAKAKAEVAEWQNKYLRLHAEWDTYRRRTNEQREQEKARATEKLVGDLLPVLDDFERTIDYAQQNGCENLLGGVEAVYSKLVNTLQTDGVEVLDPAGQPFDALEHQAVATVEDAEAFDETVSAVFQKGYKMGGKVIRPAMVTVTTGGPKRPAEENEE